MEAQIAANQGRASDESPPDICPNAPECDEERMKDCVSWALRRAKRAFWVHPITISLRQRYLHERDAVAAATSPGISLRSGASQSESDPTPRLASRLDGLKYTHNSTLADYWAVVDTLQALEEETRRLAGMCYIHEDGRRWTVKQIMARASDLGIYSSEPTINRRLRYAKAVLSIHLGVWERCLYRDAALAMLFEDDRKLIEKGG